MNTTVLLRQRILTGTYGGSIHPRRHIPEFVDLFMQGRLDLAGILDTRYTIDEALAGARRPPSRTGHAGRDRVPRLGEGHMTGSISFDEIESRPGFLATGAKPDAIDWLPEPPRARRHVPLISVDDHLVEPPHVFEGRISARFADRAPRVMTEDDGRSEYWLYDDQRHYKVGLNAVVGKPLHQRTFDPARFDEMRRGAWDIHARIADMDLNGVYASICFPSSLAGFAGQRYQLGVSDRELAWAVVRAANDWHLEEWAGTYPGRIIPLQLPWLLDPVEGGDEIRRNAERGFRAVTFPELPERLGLPSLHTGYWDPFVAACEETETVICLHVGSSSSAPATSTGAPSDTIGVLFFGWAMFAAVDWLYSKIPVRFPDVKICLSEGGIGWVAGLLDRLDHVGRYQRDLRDMGRHRDDSPRGDAAELLVLHHRRPRRPRAAPSHRRRPRHGRVRLPPPRRHLARHPSDRLVTDRRFPHGRDRAHRLAQRIRALPPPRPRNRAGRPRGQLIAEVE